MTGETPPPTDSSGTPSPAGGAKDPDVGPGVWAWLVLDRFWLFPSGTYGVRHMKLLGVGGNLAAIASIGWVQVTGLFAAG